MKTFKISEIKEQGIWVKCTGENALRLIQAFDYEKYKEYKADARIGRFYRWDGSGFDWDYNTVMSTSSYIEFSQIDWEERKQIGWELKKDCKQYREAALKICGLDNFVVHNNNGFFTTSKEGEILRKARVLELWFEPVYEEVKFKAGDFCRKTWSGGDVDYFDITKVTSDKLYGSEYYRLGSNGSKENIKSNAYNAEINDKRYILDVISYFEFNAAKQLVLAAEKIEIGGYSVEIHNGSTRISGYEFTKEFWEAALIVSKHQKAKIKIGCSHQFDLPTETIERILSKLK